MKNMNEIKQLYLKANHTSDVKGLCSVFHVLPTDTFDLYPETPPNSVVFAMSGSDGLHYCMCDDGMHCGIYLVIPNQNPSLYKLASSMDEFLSYTLSIYGMFESALTCDEITFLDMMNDMEAEMMSMLGSEQCRDDMVAWQAYFKIQYTEPHRVYQLLRAYQVHM